MVQFAIGIVLIALLAPGQGDAQPAPGDVVINEIMYAPTPSTNEFIELYNRGDTAVALNDLAFSDDNLEYEPVTSTDTTLESEEYAVLVRDPMAFESAFPTVSFLSPSGWAALNNGGDTVHLRHSPTNTPLDSVPYTSSWGGSEGRSLERIDPAGPSDTPSNFRASEAAAEGTPGEQNSVYDPDETPPTVETVTPSPDGDSLTVVFSEPVDGSTISADAFQFASAEAPSIVGAQRVSSSPTRAECLLASPLTTGDYTLLVSDVADRRGNVLDEGSASFSYFVPDSPAPTDIIISEIMYAPTTGANEFIELYNRSEKTFDLGAFQFADENRNFHGVAPPSTPLRPDDYVVIVRDAEAFEMTFPSVEYFAPDGWDALNNGGDTVVLRHGPSALDLDVVPYEPSWGGSSGHSLERIDPRGTSDRASNFASSTAAEGATPGSQNSRHAPDTTPPQPTFAEQTDSTIAEVVFDEPVQAETVTPEHFQLGETTITQVSLHADSIARLSLSERPRSASVVVSEVRDLVGNSLSQANLPFAQRPTPRTLVINEILFDPLADDFDEQPNQVEYVELHNLADHPITLNGLTLTDRPTEEGTADTLRVGRRQWVSPGSHAVIAAAPNSMTELPQSQLATAFPDMPRTPDSVAYLPVDAPQLDLRNDGDLVRLHRRDGTVVAEVDYTPDWHAAGLSNPKGTALERISPTTDARRTDNWTSSTASNGGTPGAPNAVSLAPADDEPEAPGLRIQPDPFSIERDGATRIRFTFNEVPSLVRVRIYDARGRRVRALEEARLVGRSGELLWNGRDDAGNRVRIGPYVVLLEAVRAEAGTTTHLKETVVLARPLN